MRIAIITLATALLTGCATTSPTAQTTRTAASQLPPRGHLTTRAHLLNGPRVMAAEHPHGRTLTMFGDNAAQARLLVAGCANATRCAGSGVINAATIGCPPDDAELWFFATLAPHGTDL